MHGVALASGASHQTQYERQCGIGDGCNLSRERIRDLLIRFGRLSVRDAGGPFAWFVLSACRSGVPAGTDGDSRLIVPRNQADSSRIRVR
jgi:hypothetical protein